MLIDLSDKEVTKLAIDLTAVRVHQHGVRALKKRERKQTGRCEDAFGTNEIYKDK